MTSNRLLVIIPGVVSCCLLPQAAEAHRQYAPQHRRFMQRDPRSYMDGTNLYCYTRCAPVNLRDPNGELVPGLGSISNLVNLLRLVGCCWCSQQGWQVKCDPAGCGGLCGFASPQAPPPNSPPPPGGPCDYPNRRVCTGLPGIGQACWESQCVCQCAGDSPTMNCIRGCIRCADSNGAPAVPGTELWCAQHCPPMTPNEANRWACCIGPQGCLAVGANPNPPMNPPPGNPCQAMPIP
jgi:hypothetical protein